MKIIDIYKNSPATVISIEILPPRNGQDEKVIFEIIRELDKYKISFVSITMGSDTSLRGGNLALAYLIKSKCNIEVLAHCTAISRSKDEIENLLTECRYLGLENILALRGDPPVGEDGFLQHKNGHRYASEMIKQIVQMNSGRYLVRKNDSIYDYTKGVGYFKNGIHSSFCIGAAGHPDGHPDCKNYEENFIHLKEKQDAGAEFIITQAFFNIDIFKRFVDKAESYGIKIPIIAGVMPVLNMKNIEMVQGLFKVDIPKDMLAVYEKNKDNPDAFKRIGIDYTASLCRELFNMNVPGIQFFTLNRRGVIPEILSMI